MKRTLRVCGLVLFLSSLAQAQTFSSGSTGADGPLDLTSGDRTVQLPESGILNYTTVNIPAGRTLRFKRNSHNTPVYMLAQGNVSIAGVVDVTAGSDPDTPASAQTPGPGGFYGGNLGQLGFGPGGGQPLPGDVNGRWIGPLSLVPLIGGSGGYDKGAGGGGAIAIASSASITISGAVHAWSACLGCFRGGSGGAIRLVANAITVSGDLNAHSSFGGSGNNGNPGVVHLEAPAGALTFTGTSSPPAGLFPINPIITQANSPSLTITSVGGFPVPSYAGKRFDTYDMLLPNQLPDPINVVVQANNIPVGTQVSIGIVNGSPSATTTPASLQGTFSSSTATPTVSSLNRAAVTYLIASATFDPPAGSAPFNQKGANYVDKVRVESLVGAKPRFVFLRIDGSVISEEKLLPQFLAQFGQ